MTLIELLLALALSAVLLTIMAAALRSAIDTAVSGRGDVEQMRIVQGVMTLVAEDIQGAALVETLDISGAMQLAEEAAGFDVDSIDTETLGASSEGGGPGTTPGGGSGLEGSQQSGSISNRRPLGVTGYPNELWIDVLREKPQMLLDEQGMVVATAAEGGIYTVRYAVGDGIATLGTPKSTIAQRDNFGLIRQEMNRDMLNWAEQTGSMAEVAGEPLLVAAEVEQIEFRYFDGFEYYETWDPLMQGPWPLAIEVRMWFVHTDEEGEVDRHHQEFPYILTVALPSAWNPGDTMTMPGDPAAGGSQPTGMEGSGL